MLQPPKRTGSSALTPSGTIPLPATLDSTSTNSLCRLGLATPSEQDGKLTITAVGYRRLKELQTDRWKRLPRKSESGVAKTISWTGKEMFDLASVVSQAISEQRFSSSFEDRLAMRREFVALGHLPSVGQFDNAVNIFRSAKTSGEVFEIMAHHRSYGDWWRALSDEERKLLVIERKKAQRAFVDSLTPQERSDRRRNVNAALNTKALGDGEQPNLELSSALSKALQLSNQIKYLEKGLAPGSMYSYTGVPEKMRSSWEALFAKVVSTQPNRFYIYEPMGFPLMGTDGRITAYHPDFFVYKTSPNGDLVATAVEIKGELLAVGQRKIILFQKLYFRGDFTDLTPAQRATIEPLVEEAKKQALKQFRFSFGPRARFCVHGYQTWDKHENCFIQDGSNKSGASHVGLIKRLQKKYPELVPPTAGTRLSNSRRNELLRSASTEPEDCKTVPSRGAAIARSPEVIIESKSLTKLYYTYRAVQQALMNLEDRGEVNIPEDDAERFTQQALAPYFDLVTVWHATNKTMQKNLLEKLSNAQLQSGSHSAVLLGGFFLQAAAQLLQERVGFDFTEQPALSSAAQDQLRLNAIAVTDAARPMIRQAEGLATRSKASSEMWKDFSKALKTEFKSVVEQFATTTTGIDVDVPYVAKQYVYWCARGLFQLQLIRPTPATMHGDWKAAWQAEKVSFD